MAVEFVDSESGEVLTPDSKGRVVIDGVEVRVKTTRVNVWPVICLFALIIGGLIGGGVATNMARDDAARAGCILDPYAEGVTFGEEIGLTLAR